MSILFKQRPNQPVSLSVRLFFGIRFAVWWPFKWFIFLLLLRPNAVYLRMNKPFILDAKRIIDFTTMTRFEHVHCGTRKDRHIIHRNISLKFCCLLSLSTVNEQNKQQKFQSTYNFRNSNSNFFAIRFILDKFFFGLLQTFFQSRKKLSNGSCSCVQKRLLCWISFNA